MKRITEEQEEFFLDPEKANEYLKEVRRSPKARYMNFLATLKKIDLKGKYLDVGCGPGILTKQIARQHPQVEITGIDNSDEMIALARQDLDKNLRERIHYKHGDACQLDSLEGIGKFDLIYSTYTMHHWADAKEAIGNLLSLLNDNGVLYIHDLKRVWWLYYFKSQSGFMRSVRASYRPAELKVIFKELGIDNFDIRTIFPFFMISVIVRKAFTL
jgi:2-polyprenyl-3-methyl-5-hydroxy-6-metoxy-1,4-benzoquinol methylase